MRGPDLAFLTTRSQVIVQAQVAGLGFLLPEASAPPSAAGSCGAMDDFPPPLCKPLPGSKGGGALEVIHLHIRAAADVGAKRMLAVRDRLRRDPAAAERYNALQIAGARGELAPASFDCARRAFFFAAASDVATVSPGSGSSS